MKKERNYNPSEAHRKSQHKKHLEKLKNEKKARVLEQKSTVDLAQLQNQVLSLQQSLKDSKSKTETAQIKEKVKTLNDEIALVKDAKAKLGVSLKASPHESRHQEAVPSDVRVIYLPPGRALNEVEQKLPDQSPYYHEIYNPFGAPPPGVPPLAFAIVVRQEKQKRKLNVVYSTAESDLKKSRHLPAGTIDPLKPINQAPLPARLSPVQMDAGVVYRAAPQVQACSERLEAHTQALDPSLVKYTSTTHIPLPSGPAKPETSSIYFFELSQLPVYLLETKEIAGQIWKSNEELLRKYAKEKNSRPLSDNVD